MKKVQLVDKRLDKSQFITLVTSELRKFRQHAHRVAQQYGAVKKLKEKLPPNHITCQVDFAENYTCSWKEEIQSAYYCKDSLTVHPAVFHWREDGELKTKSTVFTSDVTDHDASMVFAMMKRIVTAAKVLLPNLQFVHYLSDSPSSQYRNRHIIRVISAHKSIFGVDCTWTWFESGHGKGPCDGVGGTAKRNADMAVKRLDANISNAHSFAEWGNRSGGKLEYEVVNGAEYDVAKVELNQMEAKVVAGSQSFHAAIPVGNGDVLFRNTSCF